MQRTEAAALFGLSFSMALDLLFDPGAAVSVRQGSLKRAAWQADVAKAAPHGNDYVVAAYPSTPLRAARASAATSK